MSDISLFAFIVVPVGTALFVYGLVRWHDWRLKHHRDG